MSTLPASALSVFLLVGASAAAQTAKRPAKAEAPSPVSVYRAATLRVTIASDPRSVFEYFSDSKKLTLWFPDQAIFDPQIGGKYHFRWKDAAGIWDGVVTEFIRGNTLSFTWEPPGEPYETNVQIKFVPEGNQTIIELSHRGFTSADSLDKAIEAWRFYLENLKSVIETSTDLRVHQAPPKSAPAPARRPRRKPAA